MPETVQVQAPKQPNDITNELAVLMRKCNVEDPDKKDLRALQKHFDQTPQLYKAIINLADAARSNLIQHIVTGHLSVMAVEAQAGLLKQEMGYDQAPTVEKLLIENVVNCWLRLQYVEVNLTNKQSNTSLSVEGFWEKKLNSTQRRYLRAVETLARVRKITRATMQINIAQPGSQQVNIAGDVVKGDS